MWNNNFESYEQLGQGIQQEGFMITLQNQLDSRIFAALQGDPVELIFKYSSIDREGINDGPGIGTLYVNDVRKDTIAIHQKTNVIEISKYLVLGENTV
jgi:hypothetical protein